MRSLHQGKYWIGGYEKHGDKPKGTLTSAAFPVSHPWASYRIAGGPWKETRVEIVLDSTNEVIHTASGDESETLKRVAVDLSQFRGKAIRIRLVDEHTGHWGHLNFDDFLFHAEKPAVPDRGPTKPDDYRFSGQSPTDAAKTMTVPAGFTVSLFAGEPDVHQPIAMCFDDRGRLWVIEAYCYPKRYPHPGPIIPDAKLGDKILIFEDTDNDGKFDKKTTFLEGLNLASGIEYGFGGVWVGAAPYLLYIPVGPNDTAGEPKILLDGWGYQDTHETLNSFIWGPDGWLYGCHGVFTHSKVGKPGTTDKDRTPINAGIWRYHPQRHAFEVYAHGTSNPWGLDYNAAGDWFIEACVIPHLWHIVPGGRYERQAGSHFNPFTYTEIGTIAKHRHYVGATPHGGNGRSDRVGGGHAHSGLLCYHGGHWPTEYHGKLFMGNIHGHRINVDAVTPKGASYEGDRNPDFLLTHDKTCIIVAMQQGPDGNVYFTDWSDKQVCHKNDPQIWDRTNGRIFKVSYPNANAPYRMKFDRAISDENLFQFVTLDHRWNKRMALRKLQERNDSRTDTEREKFRKLCLDRLGSMTNRDSRLGLFWALHVTQSLEGRQLLDMMMEDNFDLLPWIVRVLPDYIATSETDSKKIKPDQLVTAMKIARGNGWRHADKAAIAALVPRLPVEHRMPLLKGLLGDAADANDPILPQLFWYALEPLFAEKATADFALLEQSAPYLVKHAARRFAESGATGAVAELIRLAGKSTTPDHAATYLRAASTAAAGRSVAVAAIDAERLGGLLAHANPRISTAALSLGVALKDPSAMKAMATIVGDPKRNSDTRIGGLTALADASFESLPTLLTQMIDDASMRPTAIRLAGRTSDAAVAKKVVAKYEEFTAAEKRLAIASLASRVAFGKLLFDAIDAKTIPASDVPAETIRSLRNFMDPAMNERILALWGSVRETAADRKKLIAAWQKKLTTATDADLAHGRTVFAKVCQQCHTLYGIGGKVGPEITGANRGDLNYLLENIFDPSAVITKEYAATKLDLTDGRVVTGIVQGQSPTLVTVITANETLQIPISQIEKRTASDLSMMPDDLTKQLSEPELKNLIAYLRHSQQVPMKATADNAKEFFNGKDFTGWDMDETAKELKVWSIENGEIVGKSATGLKRNTFLTSSLEVSDFKLTLKMKLVPNTENSGVQVRSIRIENGEMRGAQCDAGKGWWGKLYEESARGLLWKEDAERYVKENDWNEYVIEAKGSTIKTWLNGHPCVNLTDDKLAKKGLIGLQVHSGKGPIEVRFKDLKLEVVEAKR
jgi:putative membrane-bound dehydrogenase-like protein